MPLVAKPSLSSISLTSGSKNKCVSFCYDFTGDTISFIPAGPFVLEGSSFLLDMNSLSGPAGANLGAFKSLQFSITYKSALDIAGTEPNLDGSLSIYIPSTNQFVRFGQPLVVNGATPGQEFVILTGVIPIVLQPTGTIQFIKNVGYDVTLNGFLTVSLFDIDLPAYTSAGYSTSQQN